MEIEAATVGAEGGGRLEHWHGHSSRGGDECLAPSWGAWGREREGGGSATAAMISETAGVVVNEEDPEFDDIGGQVAALGATPPDVADAIAVPASRRWRGVVRRRPWE